MFFSTVASSSTNMSVACNKGGQSLTAIAKKIIFNIDNFITLIISNFITKFIHLKKSIMKKGTPFAELLVELSDPSILADFRKDPDAFLADKNLSKEEKQSLITGNSGYIRFYAKGIDERIVGDDAETMPRVVAGLAIDVIDVIDVVDVVVVAEATQNAIYVDKEGNLFT